MNGVYVSDVPACYIGDAGNGVGRKIHGQVRTLCDAGLKCKHHSVALSEFTFWDKFKARLPFGSDGLNWSVADEFLTADFLYIRRPYIISKRFIKFLNNIRTQNRKCKILLEIPTFPYDREYLCFWHRVPLLWKDRFWRRKLHLYIDRIVTFDGSRSIFNIPTIYIKNGIQMNEYRLKEQNETDCLNLCCVAQFAFWHGIDRLLLGLADYYKECVDEKEVHLYLAGEGSYITELKSMTRKLELQEKVTFCGLLHKQQLYEQIYDRCDIGIEVLGGYRKTESISSSLKSREYLAVGLPIVSSAAIDVITPGEDFFLKVPSDDSPIDIKKIVSFYDSLIKNESKTDLSKRVQLYGKERVSWEKTLYPVIDYLKNS